VIFLYHSHSEFFSSSYSEFTRYLAAEGHFSAGFWVRVRQGCRQKISRGEPTEKRLKNSNTKPFPGDNEIRPKNSTIRPLSTISVSRMKIQSGGGRGNPLSALPKDTTPKGRGSGRPPPRCRYPWRLGLELGWSWD